MRVFSKEVSLARWTRRACATAAVLMASLMLIPGIQAQVFFYMTIDGGISITGYVGPGGNIGIPSTIDGLPVLSIRSSAFSNQTNLTGITIFTNVTSIGDWAFNGCTRLRNVTVPNSVTNIAGSAFSSCPSLSAIMVDPLNPSYSSKEGVLFNKSQTALLRHPPANSVSYVIPESVTSIGGEAFSFCSTLTNITIPDSVTNIGGGAFFGCGGLTTLTIPQGVTRIEGGTFSGCSGLGSITIPDGVTNIGGGAFSACSSLTNLAIPANVTTIQGGAFSHCTKLTAVTIPNGLSTIPIQAFLECSGLAAITFPSSLTNIEFGAFDGCASLTCITIPNGVTSIGMYAFSSCSNLTGIYFKGKAPAVASSAFDHTAQATIYYLAGTTGWGTTLGGRPTEPWRLPYPIILSSGLVFGIHTNGFGFTISWATNVPVVVEVSTDLANPPWVPVSTKTLIGGAAYYSDPAWTNYPSRFYRIRSR